MSDLPSLSVNGQSQQLNEDEASELAKELKQQLRNGEVPAADGESIERMVAGLGDPRGLMRLTFAESLGVVGKAAVPSLCRALAEHESVTVRRAAAKTLTLIEDPRALPVLQKALLQDPDPVVQGSAVGAMAAVGEEAIDGMLEILINPSSTAMQLGLASWGLAFVGARAPEALRKAATSEHAEIRCAAIAALGDQIQALGDDAARELVENALTDAETDVRAEAATLLGKLHSPDWAVPRLEPLLSDPQGQVRKNAALSLMKLQAEGSIANLSQQLEREQQADVKAVLQLAINQLDQDG
ncbi:HEAT repeat domain-containing protein [Synechococcus sp. A15-44]|uniref:HEAT repeat domain-containing protein n=1 Tax=Synechococcus sp. A15-44 TaxID=1050646 RepID=UPI000D0C2B7B|nr:HEAT repeat domain-containing protein [Synechococcus sp. A15-44]AVH76635.1 putative phycoerythrin:phycoerythrobilin lyase [Synechococcus sp. A15-44]QNI63398.1 putative phycoerythrin:phycoerythrobilin lyase [Synechococcus sp. A15-44]